MPPQACALLGIALTPAESGDAGRQKFRRDGDRARGLSDEIRSAAKLRIALSATSTLPELDCASLRAAA